MTSHPDQPATLSELPGPAVAVATVLATGIVLGESADGYVFGEDTTTSRAQRRLSDRVCFQSKGSKGGPGDSSNHLPELGVLQIPQRLFVERQLSAVPLHGSVLSKQV